MRPFTPRFLILVCGFHGQIASRTEQYVDAEQCSKYSSATKSAQEQVDVLKKAVEEAESRTLKALIKKQTCSSCVAKNGFDYNVKKTPPVCELDCGKSYVLCPGTTLSNNDQLKSASGRISLIMQDDGNLVLYAGEQKPENAKWQTMTNYAASNKKLWKKGVFIFQKDYNAVIYPEEYSSNKTMIKNPKPLENVGHHVGGAWTKTGGYIEGSGGKDYPDVQLKFPTSKTYKDCDATCRIILQDDCNLVMYKGENEVIWDIGAKCGPTPAPTPSPTPSPTISAQGITKGSYRLQGSEHGNTVTCDADGRAHTYNKNHGTWETFTITPLDSDTVTLFNPTHQKYLTAVSDCWNTRCDATSVGDREKFKLIKADGGKYRMKTNCGHTVKWVDDKLDADNEEWGGRVQFWIARQ